MANHQVNNVLVSATSFDLADHIESLVSHELAAGLMQGLARSADFAIVSAARQLFRGVRESIFNSEVVADSMAELTAALNEQAFAETCFHDHGHESLGPVATLHSLWHLRQEWNNTAAELTGLTTSWDGTPRVFEIADIEMLIRQPEVNTSKKTVGRIERQVQRKAAELGIDAEDAAKTLASRIARETENNKRMAESMKLAADGVVFMMLACVEDVEEPTTSFTQLSYKIRAQLITSSIRSCELQQEWACRNGSLSDDEFDTLDMLASKTIKQLKGVLLSPAFKAAAAADAASEKSTG